MKEKRKMQIEQGKAGSALIMTVVLTVLLSIIAVMFVAVARMDMASTSNIADNKMLDSAVKSIVEIINRQLVLDTPGVAVPTQEYYDYPDSLNGWLANLEPYLYDDKGTPDTNDDIYYWRQISDVTGYLSGRKFAIRDVSVDPPGNAKVVKEYPEIILDANGEPNAGKLDDGRLNNEYRGQVADADGDGILDSKWFELKNMRTSKGKPIYAAVRVIDNGGMVNINTAYSFDADDANANEIDGSSQMQVNLRGLLKGSDTISKLHEARRGSGDPNWDSFSRKVIWNYGVPDGNYLPFDISDELELRYRYCIDGKIISRFEVNDPCTVKGAGTANFGNLYDGSTTDGDNPWASNWRLSDWQHRITDPCYPHADRRHLLTALNLDRIIDPDGGKMTNINDADVNNLYSSIRRGLFDANPAYPDVNGVAAQIAVNIIDYRDNDSNVTAIDVNGVTYYGFERPCIYISELACDINVDGPHRSYAVELYKPYPEDGDPNGWKLFIDSDQYDVNWSGTKQFCIMAWQDLSCPNCPLTIIDYNNASVQVFDNSVAQKVVFNTVSGSADSIVSLVRDVCGVNVVVDSHIIPKDQFPEDSSEHSIQRDIAKHKCIRRRLWASAAEANTPTLGSVNNYISPDANLIQAHPANSDFNNIGQIGMVFRKAAYYKYGDLPTDVIGYGVNKTEPDVRLNLADPDFQQVFKYLTVIDPYNFHPTDPNYADERRIKGRININTAPAYVLAQLPWVSQRKNNYNDANLAKAIIAYRDRTAVPSGDPNYSNRPGAAGFGSIGELCDVCDVNISTLNFGIDYYSRDGIDQTGFPDLTGSDGAIDDFEERDLIFARISDLVTVRSDVFTAYILVRIGTDGPQKRVITILDRSGVTAANNRVAIRAFQLTPEAR